MAFPQGVPSSCTADASVREPEAIRLGEPFDRPVADAALNLRVIDVFRSESSGGWEAP
jgi:hypothetical protein